MITETIILSSAGLKNIIKDNKEIRMNSIFAEFFFANCYPSSLFSDPTINQKCYNPPPNTKITRFKSEATEFSETMSHKMRLISILLCNEENYNKLYPVDYNANEPVKGLEELLICEIMKTITNQDRLKKHRFSDRPVLLFD